VINLVPSHKVHSLSLLTLSQLPPHVTHSTSERAAGRMLLVLLMVTLADFVSVTMDTGEMECNVNVSSIPSWFFVVVVL
jgi:hypothetical protein